MRTRFGVLAILLLLSASASASRAHAQAPPSSRPVLYNVYGPYSVYGPGLTYTPPAPYNGPYASSSGTYVRVGSALVPDGGEALLGGYSRVSEGRNEAGVPGLGKVPYLNRPFDNVGYSRSVRVGTASARVRVIRMSEEEERQTGVRP